MFSERVKKIKVVFKQRTNIVKRNNGTLTTNQNEVVDKVKNATGKVLNNKELRRGSTR